ncbi:MAG: hypothetical protein ABR915_04470 [Thermoguttaceae bacterium]
MFNRAMLVALAVGLVGFAYASAALAGDPPSAKKATITGMGKALGDAGGKLDPSAANATVTVTKNGAKIVYDVYGWGGIIIAKQADGKKVDVTGVVGERDGKKTITAASVGVKIIVVEEKAAKKQGQ